MQLECQHRGEAHTKSRVQKKVTNETSVWLKFNVCNIQMPFTARGGIVEVVNGDYIEFRGFRLCDAFRLEWRYAVVCEV